MLETFGLLPQYALDLSITHFLNQFAQQSKLWDMLMVKLIDAEVLKGGVAMAILWWMWFHSRAGRNQGQQYVLPTLLTSMAALLVARSLAYALPFRPRPILDPAISFTVPYTMTTQWLIRWSAFPSDHAVLFFALATGIYFAARKVGLLMYLYFSLVVCFPRLYLGIHWFTDLVAGAILGSAMARLGLLPAVRAWINHLLMPFAQTHPSLFYPLLFLLTYQVTTLFTDVRSLGHLVLDALRGKL